MTLQEVADWATRHGMILVDRAEHIRLCILVADLAAAEVDFDRDFDALFAQGTLMTAPPGHGLDTERTRGRASHRHHTRWLAPAFDPGGRPTKGS